MRALMIRRGFDHILFTAMLIGRHVYIIHTIGYFPSVKHQNPILLKEGGRQKLKKNRLSSSFSFSFSNFLQLTTLTTHESKQ